MGSRLWTVMRSPETLGTMSTDIPVCVVAASIRTAQTYRLWLMDRGYSHVIISMTPYAVDCYSPCNWLIVGPIPRTNRNSQTIIALELNPDEERIRIGVVREGATPNGTRHSSIFNLKTTQLRSALEALDHADECA
jgi:hypothetical protein